MVLQICIPCLNFLLKLPEKKGLPGISPPGRIPGEIRPKVYKPLMVFSHPISYNEERKVAGDPMKLRDAQAFIPGWNIVYMVKEQRKFNRAVAEMEAELKAIQLQGEKDRLLVASYASQRDAAKDRGDLKAASDLDEKIVRLVRAYLSRI